jgi:cobalamin biosynthesis protein CobD/CbiB
MPDLEITHQSVRDYIDAKKRGDRATTDRIRREVQARFARRDTDGTEMAQLGEAAANVTFGEGK